MRASPLILVPLLFVLTGCFPGAPVPPDTAPEPPVVEQPEQPEAPALAEDVLLVVTTTATADNGAVLDLTLTVHRSEAWSTAEGAARGDVMTGVCEGALDDSVYQDQLWSFGAVDVQAVERAGAAWPSDHRLFLYPSGGFVPVASTGYPVDDDEVDTATPYCLRDKFIEGPGSGTVVTGFAGDTDEVTAAGNFTSWANHNYGVVAVRVAGQTADSVGIALSDCSYLVTDAGAALGGDGSTWTDLANDTHCFVGSDSEEPEFG